MVKCSNERHSYGETKFTSLVNCLHGISTEELQEKGVCYHKNCYKELTNKALRWVRLPLHEVCMSKVSVTQPET